MIATGMLKSRIHSLAFGSLWLAANFRRFSADLRTRFEIRSLRPLSVSSWHRGARYFTGVLGGGVRVFVKTDGVHRLLGNEIAAWDVLSSAGIATSRYASVRVRSLDSGIRFAAFDLLPAMSLRKAQSQISSSEIALIEAELWRILEELSAATVIHRDISPDNLLVSLDGARIVRVHLIDFAFSVIGGKAGFDSALPVQELADMGFGYKPGRLAWDDAYACHRILTELIGRCGNCEPGVADRIGRRIGVYCHEYHQDFASGVNQPIR